MKNPKFDTWLTQSLFSVHVYGFHDVFKTITLMKGQFIFKEGFYGKFVSNANQDENACEG